MAEVKRSKFIQISAVDTGNGTVVYALDDDGQIWYRPYIVGVFWRKVPMRRDNNDAD